jgi:fructokinase
VGIIIKEETLMYDVCALGELLIDFTPSGTDEQGATLFGRNPGGAPANVLAMIHKLDGKTAFLGKVGDDEFGRFLENTLKEAGVDTAGLILDLILPKTRVALPSRGTELFPPCPQRKKLKTAEKKNT